MVYYEDYLIDNHLSIIVKANSKKSEILSYDSSKGALKVNISAPPENNKANLEIIKFFTRLSKKKVSIKSGLTSKKKLLSFE